MASALHINVISARTIAFILWKALLDLLKRTNDIVIYYNTRLLKGTNVSWWLNLHMKQARNLISAFGCFAEMSFSKIPCDPDSVLLTFRRSQLIYFDK